MSGFSQHNPKERTVWDSTLLSDLQMCPTYFNYVHNEGWSGSNVNFEFGGFAASAFEHFWRLRASGMASDAAILSTLRFLFEATWISDEADTEGGRPWGGEYVSEWRCEGVTPYRNAKGNRAKCPYSHKGMWFPPPTPDVCGECGSPTAVERHYVPADDYKHRLSLIEMVTWYMLEQPENLNDGVQPLVFPNGEVGLELSFMVPLGMKNRHGEPFMLAGHMDHPARFGDEVWIMDQKTTKKSLNELFFSGYSPNTQFDTYDMVAQMLFPDLDVQGVLLDGAQILKSGSMFGRHTYRKTDAMREEHLASVRYWVQQAETFYQTGYWPMNKANCWKCPFKGVCSADPTRRQRLLEASFKRREKTWNPAEPRNVLTGDENDDIS